MGLNRTVVIGCMLISLAVHFQIAEGKKSFVLRNKATGFCLDSNAGGKVYTLRCNKGNYQRWIQKRDGSIQNFVTGMCLDSNAKEHVYTKNCNGGRYQKWSYGPVYKNIATSKVLESGPKRNVYTIKGGKGSTYQYWDKKSAKCYIRL